jgi:hypothetical protein
MKFNLKKLLELFASPKMNTTQNVKTEDEKESIQDFPETKNLGLRNQLDFLTNYYSFLIDDFGFQLKTRRFFSREFWTIYTNSIIDVKIMFESGSELPWVYIEKCAKHDKYLNVQEYSDKIKSIVLKKKERIEPMMTRFVSNNYNYTELENDYIEFGQYEHREYMEESAKTIKDILENKTTELNAL